MTKLKSLLCKFPAMATFTSRQLPKNECLQTEYDSVCFVSIAVIFGLKQPVAKSVICYRAGIYVQYNYCLKVKYAVLCSYSVQHISVCMHKYIIMQTYIILITCTKESGAQEVEKFATVINFCESPC